MTHAQGGTKYSANHRRTLLSWGNSIPMEFAKKCQRPQEAPNKGFLFPAWFWQSPSGSNFPRMGGIRGHKHLFVMDTHNQPPILVQRSNVDSGNVRFPRCFAH